MYYVYFLELKNKLIYTGYTSNLKIRIQQHQAGEVKSTSKLLPIKLIHYSAFLYKEDAEMNEKYFKTTKGKKDLKIKLKKYFKWGV